MEKNIIKILNHGGIGVLPTDTIYGVVGSAFSRAAVRRLYILRKRDHKKPFIILLHSISDIEKFGIHPEKRVLKILHALWPGPVSIIFSCKNKKFAYLHRGTMSLAFRLPKDKKILTLLKSTGPLVAPSANISGKPPAKTIREAKEYFGNRVDFYIDRGKRVALPSTILEIKR